MVLSGLVSWCQRPDSCNGWSVRDKGGEGRNYDHNRKFFLQRKKEKQWSRRSERSQKTCFHSGEGKATIPFLPNKCNLRKNNTEEGETCPIYLGSGRLCTVVTNILCGGHKNNIKMHRISRHYFANLVVCSVCCVPMLR